jgi:hypothetical protein
MAALLTVPAMIQEAVNTIDVKINNWTGKKRVGRRRNHYL